MVAGLASIGIAASPEPARGSTPRHRPGPRGAVTIAVCRLHRPADATAAILSVRGSAAVTVAFVALLGWLVLETQGGSMVGLAERLMSSVLTCWPFAVAVALRRDPGS